MRRISSVAWRCAEAAITLAVLVTLAFLLAHAAPGGPAYAILGLKARPASVQALDIQLGLATPLWRQYAVWWGHLLHGQLGTSLLLSRNVAEVVGEYAGNTLALDAAGLLLALLLGTATGLAHGTAPASWYGRAINAAEIGFYAVPGYCVGAVLLLVFASRLHWLPAGGVTNLRLAHPGLGDRIAHIILPAACLMLVSFAGISRVLAQSVHAELSKDYVRAAHARGLTPSRVLWRHVLPNALRPVVTLVGMSLPGLFAGSVVVESVFSYPGLGWLLWRSAVGHDYPVLVAIVLLVGVATILGNLAADLVNGWLDPGSVYV